jgi:ABC-type Na+ efflux pump permease subunit
VIVAPVSRDTIFVGKTLGGMTNTLLQGAMLSVVGVVIGIHVNVFSLAQSIVVVPL